ncbi:MAG TPA: zinc-ribbon domain-containing protein [Pyrinomonadaceae bacterium]|nr:zinc-ribbon domain-containing protein [Pyrinomonadaceae bacterium]
MSEPEIARRCSSCGASVRQRAMFCPQCGNPVSQSQAPVTTATTPLIPETIIETAPAAKVHEDGVRSRVEKLRKVSSVVIDQAAYDPSLRFLLVAAVLFLLFLVLLILSKVIG